MTKENDTIDYICWKYYGTSKPVEDILNLNYFLSESDILLPSGLKINLPDVDLSTQEEIIRLWD